MTVTRIYWDTETTGLVPTHDRIVEVAALAVDETGAELAVFESLVQAPPEYKDSRGLQINGIAWESLLDSPSLPEVVAKLRQWMNDLGGFEPGVTWHAFNNGFDRQFLEPDPWCIYGLWEECVMLAAHKAMATRKWPRLREAAAQFGVSQPSAHRALVDARTACLVHGAILRARRAVV